MADKIKSFFQQKKKNAKFMNAGKGYKLTDSTSTRLASAEPAKPVLRAEPTEEAKVAGQAALARLEAKKVDKPKFNTGKEKIENCVETLGKYLENIIKDPVMEKYWKIRMSNRIFQEKILPVEGALDFLKAAGFDQKVLRHNENEEDFLVWNPDNCNIEELVILSDALKSAEQIPIELDRNLQVLMPCQARVRNELPPSFFTISPEEIKREQQLRTEAVERNQMLRTKAMREKDEQRILRRYKFAVLRIKFPDGLILQGTFMVHEKFRNVLEFVTENLAYHEVPFSLMTPDGIKLVEECLEKTLLELRLIPTAILEFSWNTSDGSSCSNMPTGYLKEEILSYIQSI
ncbi:UBX domain-containing protein 1 [Harpegnathos saltator]|uniref:UBX domain-containing protein 1 n=1 Tax=Harpegnathos saltator TaxID=610380 RepID=E2B756_HARSA|nr:UBX domain-containing protein 1 [Harpegnathos saltator]